MIEHINYRVSPQQFANKCIVNTKIFETVSNLIEGYEEISAHDLIALAVLAEAVVFNERLIVEDGVIFDYETEDTEFGLSGGAVEILATLTRGKAVESVTPESAANQIYTEAVVLAMPGAEPIRTSMIHESYIVIETDPEKYQSIPVDRLTEYKWKSLLDKTYDPNYLTALDKYGYNDERYVDFRPPWKLLADCHGIPYISDAFYTVRDVNIKYPTNIGVELYTKIVELHEAYFKKIQNYLGPTYVYIPPILSLVLELCKTPDDIPIALMSLRHKYTSLRKKCTTLETDLRQAKSIQDQIEIIRDIDIAYNAIASKVSTPDRRLILRLFDVVKEIDPLHMSIEALNQANELILEQDGVLKIPGYYNFWKATTQVEQGLPLLKRVFKNQVTPKLLSDMNKLVRSTEKM